MLVDVDFLDHWRTRLVVDQLGGDEFAPLYILRIWAHCQTRKAWRFEGMTAAGLRSLCRCAGDADRLEAALKEAGFIERNGNAIEVPKWAVHNASLIATWENGRKGGRPPKQPENPNETHGKPTGLNGQTHGKPKRNPDETDKTRGDERRREETRTFVKKSKGDGKTKVSNHRQPSPLNARGERGEEDKLDLSLADWPRIVGMASAVARKIPVLSTADRRDWLKHAVVANLYFSEDWLMDSVEAVLQSKETRETKQAHLIGVLRKKAVEQFEFDLNAFKSMVERIEIPDHIWDDKSVLEVRRCTKT